MIDVRHGQKTGDHQRSENDPRDADEKARISSEDEIEGLRERLAPEQWHVLIRDAHPGYISWQEYERIAAQLRVSAKAIGYERNGGPPREGPALLQGRAVCGLCGSQVVRGGPALFAG